MGIRVNGCGTHTAAKKIKYLGDMECENCKTNRPFYLYELKNRITLFYVPIVKTSQKYAIMCSKCETGYYVDENKKNELLGI
jgi:hypothetical protein